MDNIQAMWFIIGVFISVMLGIGILWLSNARAVKGHNIYDTLCRHWTGYEFGMPDQTYEHCTICRSGGQHR